MQHEGRSKLLNLAVAWDGEKIIGSDARGRVKVWDVESHSLVKEWTHLDKFPRIAISPDNRLVASRSTSSQPFLAPRQKQWSRAHLQHASHSHHWGRC